MLTLDEIIDALHEHGQRATYGAVGDYFGENGHQVNWWMSTREPSHRNSWIVARNRGYPEGYCRAHIDPRMKTSPSPITTGEDLKSWLSENVAKSELAGTR
jgi:hypothetical protein